LELLLNADADAQKIGEYNIVAGTRLNLGNTYVRMGDLTTAMETYQSGIDICEKHGIKYTQASLYTSVGMVLRMQNDLDSALIYYEKVLEIHYNELHDSTVIAAVYNNIASLYFAKKDKKTAENYLLKSYEINKLMGNERYQIMNLANLAGMVGEMPGGDLSKANEYYDMALEMAYKTKSKDALQSIYEGMALVHYNHSKYREAFEYLYKANAYKDSVLGDEKQKQILAISKDFKTRQIQDSLRIKEQELALSHSNEEAANLKASKSTLQLLIAIVLLIAILVVLFFVYRHFKNQKKINELLQQKNEEIFHQKIEIEQKNTELTDSINYAKRIQQALLPSASYLQKVLGEHFLIFRPKDIVSGDFYWVKHQGNKHYFVVADCTGHGVPGAMVSMLGFETIDRVSTGDIAGSADFVVKVNDALVNSLTARNEEQTTREQQVKDGMDMSLCIVTDKQKLSYCGANNECYILRSNDKNFPADSDRIKIIRGEQFSVIELKPTKRPVGLFESDENFTSVELQLLQGDMFYLFSDGYADQFGGDKGKKMKTSAFREVLLKYANLSMKDQCKALENYLAEWQHNFDQLDDITVLGVKVE
ncbi:MAG: tetratricopeptide repeat protein, partial [Crocinitomicaceae bacterium]|nr:tetratricopeptide repeat protein [Crocinitomicaceae bacterium]